MTVPVSSKSFISVCVIVFIIYFFWIFHPNYTDNEIGNEYVKSMQNFENAKQVKIAAPTIVHKDMKYILLWTKSSGKPISWMGKGQSVFLKNNCKYTNCYVTDDREYFFDMTDFNVVVFHGKDLKPLKKSQLPKVRSVKQKYIYAMMESAHYYPVCDPHYDGFFNWTWTYRLDSDVKLGCFTIYDLEGRVIGPKADMRWPNSLKPISEDLKYRLRNKTKAAAWFVSNCIAKNDREWFALELIMKLREYNLTGDIYGSCGILKCPRNDSKLCNKMLETNYYFYWSFENSFAEDYVTEKLLTALNNLAVPVVYGAANYSRFLPPGSYLNGNELGTSKLAKTMSEIIANPARYHDMFRWRNHYRYEATASTVDICNLCALMNDRNKFETSSVHQNFREWWNVKGAC